MKSRVIISDTETLIKARNKDAACVLNARNLSRSRKMGDAEKKDETVVKGLLALPDSVKAKAADLGVLVIEEMYTAQDKSIKGPYETLKFPKDWTDEDVLAIGEDIAVLVAHKDFSYKEAVENAMVRSWQIRAKQHHNPGEAAEPKSTRGQIMKAARGLGMSADDLLAELMAKKAARDAEKAAAGEE